MGKRRNKENNDITKINKGVRGQSPGSSEKFHFLAQNLNFYYLRGQGGGGQSSPLGGGVNKSLEDGYFAIGW